MDDIIFNSDSTKSDDAAVTIDCWRKHKRLAVLSDNELDPADATATATATGVGGVSANISDRAATCAGVN